MGKTVNCFLKAVKIEVVCLIIDPSMIADILLVVHFPLVIAYFKAYTKEILNI